MRVCPVCNADMSTAHYRRKYCSRACQRRATRNNARTRTRANYVQQFVGVDGEGINLPNGEHRYVMLSVGDETLFKNGDPLGHKDCLEFVYQHFLNNPDKQAAYIGFYLGYDFTCWFKDLPEHEATMLFTPKGIAARKRESSPMPFPVYTRSGWEIDLLGMKRLRFRPHRHVSRKRKCGCGYVGECATKNDQAWCYICDVGSFFQTSFVQVLDPKGWHGETPCTQAEFDLIVTGKGKRSDKVTLDDLSWFEEMRDYNTLENHLLAEVMRIYTGGFDALGVRLTKSNLYGPGQAAQQWLNIQARNGAVITHDEIATLTPAGIIDKWRRSYYGGRFEIFQHGIVPGATYEYDIQSAYPDAIRSLPCLCSGIWTPVDDPDPLDQLALCHATVTGSSDYIGCLPYRNKQGAILYPRRVSGWYRVAEIAAAINAGLVESVEIDQAVTLTNRCNHEPPLAALADLFSERIRVGKSTPHGKALKLVYNSCYGKMAQSLGVPKYANPIYASMITSECRIKLLQAIGTHPNPLSLVMTATDGIYFNEPHPEMPTVDANVEGLGLWESGIKTNLTLMKPGVYWDDKARQAIAAGKSAKLKSRGINGKALQEHILRIDDDFREYSRNPSHGLPAITISTPFSIVSPRLALARGKWETAGHVQYDLERSDAAVIKPKRSNPKPIAQGLLISQTPDNRNAESCESYPYEKRFGFTADGEPIYDDEMFTPDGTMTDTYISALWEITK